jgi:class 3 adenylate cyclase/tetratricopeptide (TPR) repeat protein
MPVGSDVRKLAAVMFTDIAGYTAMVQQDEAYALEKVRMHRKYLEDNTQKHQGQVVQFYGDGSLSIYDSVVDAVHCAIAMQHGYLQDENLPVRIGIHLGDFVIKDGTVFGDGVNIASRIQAEGTPGAILISEKVNEELSNHSDIDTIYLGAYDLKNVSHPVNVYAVISSGLVVPVKKKSSILHPKRTLRFLIPVTVIAAVFFIAQYLKGDKTADEMIQEERIAVPEFQDYTNDAEFTTVGKMAAHWITTELIESAEASVVSYQSAVENTQVSYASIGAQRFSHHTGAINVIEGSYRFLDTKKDSLEFRAAIMNLETGAYLRAISEVVCPYADPMNCIQELGNKIKGFWVSRTDHVLRPPRYDAYKEYLNARNVWLQDQEMAGQYLRKSIALDPEFIDAYFLLMDWYYNQGQYGAVATQIKDIKSRFPDLTDRQKNYLKYYQADNQGHNIEAFNLFLEEYQIDPKDLFVNTSGMIMALEYVNAPEKAVTFFNQINPDSLDLEECAYCQTRFSAAIDAYQSLGKVKQARQLADRLREHVEGWRSYKRLIEFYVATKDTSTANAILSEATKHVGARYKPYLHFIAGVQAKLNGDTELSSLYARQALALSPDSSRMRARSQYLMDDLDGALSTYLQSVAIDSTDNQVYAELGVIYARKKDHDGAQQMVQKLTAMKPAFDYGYTPYCQGRIAANLGERDRALGLFRQALSEGARFRSSIDFLEDPDLMMLREDSEYLKILVRLPS